MSTVAGELIARDSYGEAAGMYKDGKVEKAYFNKPSDAVEDSSQNLIVADSQNHSIRIVRGANVYTYCGSLSRGYKNGGPREAKFDTPEGIAIDAEGNVYVADTGNSCIRKIDKDRNVTLFAGQPGKSGLRDGKAEQAMFFEPSGIAVDKNGTVYVADTGNQRIRSIKDGVVTTVAGGGNETVHDTGYIAGGFRDGSCTDARFSFPKGICVADNGVLFVADTQNNAVRAITQFGEVVTVAGTGETGDTDGSVLEATLHGPVDVCFAKGSLYVADTMNSSVRKVEVDMAELAVKGGTGDE